MEPEKPTSFPGEREGSTEVGSGTCVCACLCCGSASPPSLSWSRSMKRKLEGRDGEVPDGTESVVYVAKVAMEIEVAALRQALINHHQAVQKLQMELEEERNAAASSATEAMSMILRLQREKSESVMEARQFKRLAEAKMVHNQQEITALEDLLFKRDQAIEALTRAVHACRHRLHSYGIDIDGHAPPSPPKRPLDSASCSFPHFDLLLNDYPQFDHHPLGVSPPELQNLNRLISHLERKSSSTFCEVMDKRVIVRQSPCHPDSGLERSKSEDFPSTVDCVPDCGRKDDVSDKVYTVDAVHKESENYISKPMDIQNGMGVGGGIDEDEIRKLCMRLQALEADRESMRQSLLSLNIDKTELVLLKEIAQQMCEEGDLEGRVAKKPPAVKRLSFMSMIKSFFSFFWRPSQLRYTFGLSVGIVGLLMLLDKSINTRHGKHLLRRA
ncbi:myosin-binding protein 7-like [Curcuma longa]|uniref:myosin-binding protein 7-like n=1 Tax=Curcuma longa TaxID=136217 RepID=UPI003D9EC40A